MFEYTKRSRYAGIVAFHLALGLSGFACSSGSSGGGRETTADTGSIDLALSAATLTLDHVDYTIEHTNGFRKSGTIDVTYSTQIAATIGGIPAGTGYYIRLTAVGAEDPRATCAGSAVADVVAGSTTTANIVLSCRTSSGTGSVKVQGTINLCPTIVSLSVVPAQTTVGHSVSLSALGQDADDGPSPLAYSWWANSGTIADPHAANTTFTCTQTGPVVLSLGVLDGDDYACAVHQTQVVQCTASTPDGGAGGAGGAGGGGSGGGSSGSAGGGASGTGPCGNGSLEAGEACDDGNATSGDGCSDTCQLDDDQSTPGDDRAGYVACSDTDNVHGLTCKPGFYCCSSTESCVDGFSGDCPNGFGSQSCDGPEDCVAGLVCRVYKATSCGEPSEGIVYSFRCHTGADCKVGQVCDSRGYCSTLP